MSTIPHCLDNRLTDGCKVGGCTLLPRNIVFRCSLPLELSKPQGLVRPEASGKLKQNSFTSWGSRKVGMGKLWEQSGILHFLGREAYRLSAFLVTLLMTASHNSPYYCRETSYMTPSPDSLAVTRCEYATRVFDSTTERA
jgi:hypothetical protein